MKTFAVCGAACAALFAGLAHADIRVVERANEYVVRPGDSAFNGAALRADLHKRFTADAPGDSRNFQFSKFANDAGLTVQGSGGMVVSGLNFPSPTTYAYTVTSPDGLPGGELVRALYPADNSALFREMIGDQLTLHYRSGSGGGVDDGGRYSFDLVVEGFWGLGTGPGQLEHINFNPLWTVDTFWQYDPSRGPIGSTVFSAHIDAYFAEGGLQVPRPEFRLWVPTPAAGGVLALAGLMAARRQRS